MTMDAIQTAHFEFRENRDTANKYPGMQSIDFIGTPSTDGQQNFDVDIGCRFPIRSCRINNFTSRWLQVYPTWDIIPPHSFGAVINVRGLGTLRVASIAILTSSAAVIDLTGEQNVNEQVIVTAFDKPQMPQQARSLLDDSVGTRIAWKFSAAAPHNNSVPVNQIWRLLGGHINFATSAVVGNRFPQIRLMELGHPYFMAQAPAGIAANTTRHLSFNPGVNSQAGALAGANGVDVIGINSQIYALPTWLWSVNDAAGIDAAGDTYDSDFEFIAYLI